MIMILMEWAYMATLSFLMGFACLAPFRKKGGCQIHSAVTYMMAGLLVLNVYAEYFSLFAGVGFWASLIAVFAAVIGGMLLRQDLASTLLAPGCGSSPLPAAACCRLRILPAQTPQGAPLCWCQGRLL